MNAYGRRAMEYMTLHRPQALAEIADRESYFSDLGERILAQVLEVTETLAGPPRPGEGFTQRSGRIRMARLMAEERVLGDLVYSSREESDEEPARDESGAWIGGPPGWEPLMPPEPPEDEED